MKLTAEQEAIIRSTGNIKINAVAGSGKTTTIVEYAKARPVQSRILYLAFNKSVKLEAVKRFAKEGLPNITVETAHSLAFKHIVYKNGYRVKAQGYKINEITELLQLQATGEKHTEYIVANHIAKLMTLFCNSDKKRVQDLAYADTVSDAKAKAFVNSYYPYIEKQTRLLLARMDKGGIEITHDFYLKKFQLSQPRLPYDYILFDEAQDASAAMLDIFLQQPATKVMVGDTHQQIYSWRYAVNSLERVAFQTFQLSASFRFNQDVADLAVQVLGYKKLLHKEHTITITGRGNNTKTLTKAVLARTNLGLLLKAIEQVMVKKDAKRIYFEGNINSYTYADEGASLYDVLHLFNNKHHLIRDKLIGAMKDMEELEDYIEKTEEAQLGMMVEIVQEYGNEIPAILKAIKDKHIEGDDKDKADLIFSTIHRCKGMEYDSIELVNDFITEEKLKKLAEDKTENTDFARLNEEINLLYVAVTRTKNKLYLPETLLPAGFPPSLYIHPIKVETKTVKEEKQQPARRLRYLGKREKNESLDRQKYSVAEAKEKNKAAYQPWTEDEDNELTKMYYDGTSVKLMSQHFGRSATAISARIKKLDLWDV